MQQPRHRAIWTPARRPTVAILAAAALCVAFATDARAACFSGTPGSSGKKFSVPRIRFESRAGAAATDDPGDSNAIVGLWQVTFLLGDGPTIYDQGFELFHADGTELNVDNGVPPSFGNVCVGVWKPVGPRTVKLRHVTWNWDENGKLAGTFLLLMTVTVDRRGNAYAGSYVSDSFDLQGKVIPELHAEGVVKATRIGVE